MDYAREKEFREFGVLEHRDGPILLDKLIPRYQKLNAQFQGFGYTR